MSRCVARRAVLVAVAGLAAVGLLPQAVHAYTFRDDWAVEDGFTLEVDTQGYELPTAIAFVPDPGRGQKSPLYFVVELRGKVKVVARDRTVTEFADVHIPPPPDNYPAISAQNGSAGICLDPRHGYVFVTYAAYDAQGGLRNHLVRFSSRPGTFSLHASSRREIGAPFAPYPTRVNHQIGGCVVSGDSLFVGVGDGTFASRAQNLDQLSGKVVRMTVDGKPHPDNPFRGAGLPRRYVYAYGLRNPFGLTLAEGGLFATQNGNSIDSFLRIDRARNYRWDGTDATIALDAQAVFVPAIAPVHVAYAPSSSRLFPEALRSNFFIGSAQSSAERGAGVIALPYDVPSRLVTGPPRHVVRFRRPQGGEIAAVALGPDGLYFAAIVPNLDGVTPVYRLRYAPTGSYPNTLGAESSGSVLFQKYGCSGCHQLGGVGGDIGPALDEPALQQRIAERLDSPDYIERLDLLDQQDAQPLRASRPFRRAMREATPDERVRLWLKYRLLEPRFDDLQAMMPTLGLTKTEAETLAGYLLTGEPEVEVGAPEDDSLGARARRIATSKRFVGGIVVGFAAALALFALVALVGRRRRAAG